MVDLKNISALFGGKVETDLPYFQLESTLNRFIKINFSSLLEKSLTCYLSSQCFKMTFLGTVVFDYPLKEFYVSRTLYFLIQRRKMQFYSCGSPDGELWSRGEEL